MNKDAQLAALASQDGYEEGPNNENDFTKWQTDNAWSGAAWCDSFAQWGAVDAGGFLWQDYCQFGVKGDAYTPWTINHAKDAGLWVDKHESPQPGWQVLYDWNDNGVADHIGTVWDARSYPNGSVVTIEGNTGTGEVKYCLRDSRYIMGFVALPQDAAPWTPPPQVPITPPTDDGAVGKVVWPVLSQSTGKGQPMYTKIVQQATGTDADGDFGPWTRSAVIDWQRRFSLTPDGVVGLITATAVIQAFLDFFGYNAGGIDGDCGPQTTTAIKAFQSASSLTPDGEFGPDSTTAMFYAMGLS